MEVDTVVCGDCLDVMRDMPDGCVDLSVVDPPFNLGFDYGPGSDDNKPLDEYRQWLKTIMDEVERITKEGRLIFLWQAMRHCLLVWNDYPQARLMAGCKDFVQMRKVDVQWAFDPILFWHKGKTEYQFASRGPIGCRRDWVVGNHIPERNSGEAKWHPCPRPMSHVEYVVNQWSKKGDLVFDPFLGSGTTAVAALKLGRHFYGCDINEEYVKLANERIEKTRLEMSQMELSLG